MFPRQFLVQMAHDRELSPEQEEVFLLRFAENMEYEEIAELLQTSEGACLKRMGQVYNKFGIDGFTRGKENRLRIYLHSQTPRYGEASETANIGALERKKTAEFSISNTANLLTKTQTEESDGLPLILHPTNRPVVRESLDDRSWLVPGLELPEGQVSLASSFYIERPPMEERCYEMILQPGALIRIKAPQQMGKTSLMARILNHAAKRGYKTVSLNFQLAERSVFSNLDQLLRWLCAYIGLELQLPNKLVDYWDDILGSKINCTAYFEKYLLAQIERPIVLGLDEVERVFHCPEIAEEFFDILRTWHEESKKREIWKKLRLVVVNSTEAYLPLTINKSPFNVGLPIDLGEFTTAQIQELAQRYGLNWNTSQVEQLMNMVGGHPYLIRLALYLMARVDTTLEKLLETAPTEAGIYSDHLRRHLWSLQQHPELAAAVREIISTSNPVRLDAIVAFKLHSMGLVHLEGNDVKLRCDLYRQYFQARLGNSG